MIQNNPVLWWGKKNITPNGILNAETTVDTFIALACQKVPAAMHISRLFDKRFHGQISLPTMKSLGVLLSQLFVLSGCLAAPIKPSIFRMNAIRTVLVVPVESPPLEVIPDLIEARFPVYRQYHYQAMPYTVFLEENIYKNPGGVLISGLISKDDSVTVADNQQASADMGKPAGLEPLASPPVYWTPTLILAQEAVSRLTADRIKATLSKHYYRLPMASGDPNANLGKWHKAIGQWYNQSMSSVDYRQPGMKHADAVLEVGIENCRIFDTQTSLQVLIKLIDPNTRQVIGRISEKTFSVEDSPQTLLSHEAEKFKQLMSEMGTQLITRGFSDLGLPLKVSGQHIKPAQSAVDTFTP